METSTSNLGSDDSLSPPKITAYFPSSKRGNKGARKGKGKEPQLPSVYNTPESSPGNDTGQDNSSDVSIGGNTDPSRDPVCNSSHSEFDVTSSSTNSESPALQENNPFSLYDLTVSNTGGLSHIRSTCPDCSNPESLLHSAADKPSPVKESHQLSVTISMKSDVVTESLLQPRNKFKKGAVEPLVTTDEATMESQAFQNTKTRRGTKTQRKTDKSLVTPAEAVAAPPSLGTKAKTIHETNLPFMPQEETIEAIPSHPEIKTGKGMGIPSVVLEKKVITSPSRMIKGMVPHSLTPEKASPSQPSSKIRRKGKAKSQPGLITAGAEANKPKPGRRKKKMPEPVQKNTITDYFPVRRSGRQTTSEIEKEKSKQLEKLILSECENGLKITEFESKGRGVIATREFSKGDFVVEYAGELIDVTTAKEREIVYGKDPKIGCYMYFFSIGSKQYCVDATAESGRLGRLVNHSREGNCCTKAVIVKGRPHLILVASTDIQAGQELSYDYGDRSKAALEAHPWLKC